MRLTALGWVAFFTVLACAANEDADKTLLPPTIVEDASATFASCGGDGYWSVTAKVDDPAGADTVTQVVASLYFLGLVVTEDRRDPTNLSTSEGGTTVHLGTIELAYLGDAIWQGEFTAEELIASAYGYRFLTCDLGQVSVEIRAENSVEDPGQGRGLTDEFALVAGVANTPPDVGELVLTCDDGVWYGQADASDSDPGDSIEGVWMEVDSLSDPADGYTGFDLYWNNEESWEGSDHNPCPEDPADVSATAYVYDYSGNERSVFFDL